MSGVVYLHGFASSPHSQKATILGSRLREQGFTVDIPALSSDSLRDLTLSSQLEIIHAVVAGRRVSLSGASMGGYLAALYAARHPDAVERLVLLAPAFGLARRWVDQLGEERARAWREVGILPVMNYATSQMDVLGWGLIEDGLRYEDEPAITQPCLIYHGLQDNVVPIAASRAFARTRTCCELREVDSDHQLGDAIDEIWRGMSSFLRP
jgi:pimeloyl-ACP methyl ester carboxylesterase